LCAGGRLVFSSDTTDQKKDYGEAKTDSKLIICSKEKAIGYRRILKMPDLSIKKIDETRKNLELL
jgi:hypothetical protein